MNEQVGTIKQPIVIGVDPGSKHEAMTVKSHSHTYLNVQAEAIDGNFIKNKVAGRRNARRARRYRKTPYRKCRPNRTSLNKNGRIPPSTKSRWQWKTRIISCLKKLFPIVSNVTEDVKAETKKGSNKWNNSFSPIQTGKLWYYLSICRLNDN